MRIHIEFRVTLRQKMPANILCAREGRDHLVQSDKTSSLTCSDDALDHILLSSQPLDRQATLPQRQQRQAVPADISMHYDNADLVRLIASSISVRGRVGSLSEERMKILRRLAEEETRTGASVDGEQRPLQKNLAKRSSLSQSVGDEKSGVNSELNGDVNNADDETLSPEEEAAAQAATARRGLPRGSVQYDNPELIRLVANSANSSAAGSRKGSSNTRGGSFNDERMSYRTALEKLMPSSMVNERETEEMEGAKDGKRDSTSSGSSTESQDDDENQEFPNVTPIADSICKMFEHCSTGKVCVNKFLNALSETGIRMTDSRLRDSMHKLKHVLRRMGTVFDSTNNCLLDAEEFKNSISKDIVFVNRVLRTSFVIPEWQEFCRHVFALYSSCKKNNAGQVSNFIPQLADYDPNLWGVSVCSVDGQRFSAGDVNVPFCLQACARVLNYAIALNDHGAEKVHTYVGQEPSGRDIRELVLDENNKPHNPMINAGAIVIASLVKDEYAHMADRFDAIHKIYSKMAGKEHLGFSNTSYLSEREISYRNFALGYFLRENRCFPDNAKLNETIELLLQLYSIEETCESLAVVAATLANGGVCPTTGDFVIGSQCVRDVLSLMYSCGMNDYSGKFAFHVGLPARSSIPGAIMLVVPNVMGVCLWSPPLDQYQNSVRGVQFCTELVKTFNFHNYDNLRFTQRKLDPRRMQVEMKTQQVVLTLFSAANGDITALRRFLLQGVDLTSADYDGRTPLHVAASEGHMHCVKFLLQKARVPSQPLDRWQGTPADDARARGFDEIADYLDKWHMAAKSRPRFGIPESISTPSLRSTHRRLPRSIADTFADDCSQYLSDYENVEGGSSFESWTAVVLE